eukprot:1014614-Pelagomonas_calceolata.AAC.2
MSAEGQNESTGGNDTPCMKSRGADNVARKASCLAPRLSPEQARDTPRDSRPRNPVRLQSVPTARSAAHVQHHGNTASNTTFSSQHRSRLAPWLTQ